MTEASVTGSLMQRLRERRREALRATAVYLVTEEALSAGRRSEAVVAAALEAGVRAIQVREKEGTARRALEIARATRMLTRQYDALLLVNDRIDLALAVDADGVHLGQGDLPVDVARRLLGPDALVGLSITAASQLAADDAGEADYLGVGAVFPTGSKQDATLTGLPLLSSARAAQAAPIIAIGGIAVDNAAAALRAGADEVAVISAITEAPDPLAAARRLLAIVGEVRAAGASTRRGYGGRLGCAGPRPESASMTQRNGEFELIAELASLLDRPSDGIGIGDDAATWPVSPGLVAVGTTDMLVEGIHFRLDWTSPRDLGWKALAVNLSDLAAMGARPSRALVSIALLADQGDLARQLYEGMCDLARMTGTLIVGGDTVRTPGPLVINVAIFGEADPRRLLRRDAALPGDLIAVTGRVGASAAGLALLAEAGPGGAGPIPREAEPLLAAHHRPWPRLTAGRRLAELGVRCAIDISDGVASEAWHVAEASNVAVEIDADALPLDATAVALLGEGRARSLALSGGEDYELLFTLPAARLGETAAALADEVGLTVVGRVLAPVAGGSVQVTEAGRRIEPRARGYVAF